MKNSFRIILLVGILLLQGVLFSKGAVGGEEYPFRNKNLSVQERLDDLLGRMTLEEKIDLLAGYQDFFLHPCERLGIPAFQLADGPLGIASWGLFGRATAFPAALSVAASWNRTLALRTGAMYAEEWRARGIHFLLAPGVNVYRASKGARNFEYLGEDPYLSSAMVVPFIKGVQGGGVIATIKHFAANDQEFDRYTVSSEISERTLQEICLPPFKAAVHEAGVKAVMSGYNPLNGVYTAENRHLIDILKKDWGFQGILMSDWGATHSAEEAANAGLDLEMGSDYFFNRKQLLPLIKSGKVTEEVIDDKVRRIYGACIAMGFFDREQRDSTIPLYNPEANKMALEAAEEGMVLLKNQNNILPFDSKKIRTIAVIGPTANPSVISDRIFANNGIVYGGGGSSKVNPWYIVTDLDGISRRFSEAKVLYTEGISNRFKSQIFRSCKFQTAEGKSGLEGKYYRQTIASDNLVAQRMDANINYEWGGKPHNLEQVGDEYAIRWEGYVQPEKDDQLIFFVDAQGGYRLWIDGRMVMDASESQSFDVRHYGLQVVRGERKKIELEFYSQKCYPAEIRMGYAYQSDIDFREAEKIASMSDMVVFCAGLDGAIEFEGRDRPFELPYGQDSLINRLAEINPNIVVVVHAGGGVDMTPWIDRVPAVVHAFYPGQEGGNALAAILTGEVNPSAKLPFTIEKRWEDSPACGNYDETRREKKIYYREGIFVGYRGFDKRAIEPLFPFGYGLSYTDFEYSGLKVQVTDKKAQQVKVSFVIKNTGNRAGAEVAQVYVRDCVSAEERPLKELKGFDKVVLNPGESRSIEIELGKDAFQYFHSKKNSWVFEKGEFEILVGASSRDIRLKELVRL